MEGRKMKFFKDNEGRTRINFNKRDASLVNNGNKNGTWKLDVTSKSKKSKITLNVVCAEGGISTLVEDMYFTNYRNNK